MNQNLKDNHEWKMIDSVTFSKEIYRSPGNPAYIVVEIHEEEITTKTYKSSICGETKTEIEREVVKYEVTQAGQTRIHD